MNGKEENTSSSIYVINRILFMFAFYKKLHTFNSGGKKGRWIEREDMSHTGLFDSVYCRVSSQMALECGSGGSELIVLVGLF